MAVTSAHIQRRDETRPRGSAGVRCRCRRIFGSVSVKTMPIHTICAVHPYLSSPSCACNTWQFMVSFSACTIEKEKLLELQTTVRKSAWRRIFGTGQTKESVHQSVTSWWEQEENPTSFSWYDSFLVFSNMMSFLFWSGLFSLSLLKFGRQYHTYQQIYLSIMWQLDTVTLT